MSGALRRRLTLLAGLAALTPSVPALSAAIVSMRCTNPYSHASWRIRIDYRRRTVDGFAAAISARDIRWHDTTDGGRYALDRRSGVLTVVYASSMGGYALHDRCRAS